MYRLSSKSINSVYNIKFGVNNNNRYIELDFKNKSYVRGYINLLSNEISIGKYNIKKSNVHNKFILYNKNEKLILQFNGSRCKLQPINNKTDGLMKSNIIFISPIINSEKYKSYRAELMCSCDNKMLISK